MRVLLFKDPYFFSIENMPPFWFQILNVNMYMMLLHVDIEYLMKRKIWVTFFIK
jgi:hypothetical protein